MSNQDPRIGDAAMPSKRKPQPIAVPTVAMPDQVAEAAAAHQRVVDTFTEARDDVKACEQRAIEAKAADIRDDAELIAAGKKPLAPDKRTAPKAEAELEESKRRLVVASEAAVQTKAQLTAAVSAAQETWLEAVEAEDAEACESYRQALAELRAAGQRIAGTRGAVRWLGNFSAKGLPNHIAVDKLSAKIGRGSIAHPFAELADALAVIADPKPAPQPPRLVTERTAA